MKKNIIIICALLATVGLFAQQETAIITYKGMINQKYVDSFLTDLKRKEMPMNIKQSVVDMYQNASPDLFILNIRGDESFYTYDPALEIEGEYNIGSKAGKNPYYTNNNTDLILESSSALGNVSHEPLEWRITKKTKKIGDYTCYQAIASEHLYSRQGYYYDRQVIAWFAPEIPLNFGPKYYKGLPGLILQITRDKFTLVATELNLNADSEKVRIKDLRDNGEIITQKEAYARIAEIMDDRKKSQE